MPRTAHVIALALAAALALGAAAPARAELSAGAAVVDITPENGGSTLGYVRPDITMRGVHTRLTARALVLDDGDTEVALLATDLAFALDKESVVARLRETGIDHATLLYTGTHTHSGPESLADWQLERLAEAVRTARARKRPAAAAWARASVADVNQNRSIEAHLANHGMDLFYGQGHAVDDPEGVEHTRDRTVRVLRVSGVDGTPIGAYVHFPVHLTTLTPYGSVWDADIAATIAHHLGRRIRAEGFVTLYANGASGDLMPRFAAYNAPAVADRNGGRIAARAFRAWRTAGRRLSREVEVAARWTRRCYCGHEVEPGRRISDRPIWGASFFGGSEDGASIFHEPGQTEGRRLPADAADPVHGRKIQAAPGLVHEPIPEVQALRIGDAVLLAAPGEPSVEMGRRFQAAVAGSLPDGVRDTLVVGLSNDYMGYLTTPEEYEMQHYEGGHTVFGVWTSLLVRDALVELTRSLAAGTPAPAPDAPGGLGGTAAGEPSVGQAGAEGSIVEQPPGAAQRMSVVSVSWRGGPAGRERPLDEPFVRLERRMGGGWRTVDSDLGIGVGWAEADGRYSALYDIPPDAPLGEHRLRISSAAYDIASEPFRIVAARGLRVLGVERRRGGREIVVRAQNPPPDPRTAILWREPVPRGGAVVVRVGSRRVVARWRSSAGGWVARLPRAARAGTRVSVRARSLRDSRGNRAAGAFAGRLGAIARIDWPVDMPVGGGRTPGPFGNGQFPP